MVKAMTPILGLCYLDWSKLSQQRLQMGHTDLVAMEHLWKIVYLRVVWSRYHYQRCHVTRNDINTIRYDTIRYDSRI